MMIASGSRFVVSLLIFKCCAMPVSIVIRSKNEQKQKRKFNLRNLFSPERSLNLEAKLFSEQSLLSAHIVEPLVRVSANLNSQFNWIQKLRFFSPRSDARDGRGNSRHVMDKPEFSFGFMRSKEARACSGERSGLINAQRPN